MRTYCMPEMVARSAEELRQGGDVGEWLGLYRLHASAPVALGGVHRLVGATKHLGGTARVARARDTDAHPQRQVVAVDALRAGNLRANPLRDLERGVEI